MISESDSLPIACQGLNSPNNAKLLAFYLKLPGFFCKFFLPVQASLMANEPLRLSKTKPFSEDHKNPNCCNPAAVRNEDDHPVILPLRPSVWP
jgi:hypothetical protein